MNFLKKLKAHYVTLNFIVPMIIFLATYFISCANPVCLIIITIILVLDIIIADTPKDFFKYCATLIGGTLIGSIISTILYYYLISSDFETPIVGALISVLYCIGIILFGIIGTIIIIIKNKCKNA